MSNIMSAFSGFVSKANTNNGEGGNDNENNNDDDDNEVICSRVNFHQE